MNNFVNEQAKKFKSAKVVQLHAHRITDIERGSITVQFELAENAASALRSAALWAQKSPSKFAHDLVAAAFGGVRDSNESS